MELSDEQRRSLEDLLSRIDELDPAEVPEPAAELAELLGEILERTEQS